MTAVLASSEGYSPARYVELPTVLVVDDSPLELLGMRRELEKAGYRVLSYQIKEFSEVFKLAEVVIHEEPVLILMDVDLGLASYDGARLASTMVRLREAGSSTPVVVLHSSLPASELLVRQRQSSADAYLEKGALDALGFRLRQILVRLLPD